MFSPSVIPTGKGFQTFFGYYSGAEDYFTHISKGFLDIHDDNRTSLHPAEDVDGKYSTHLYTERASAVIEEFGARRLAGSTKKEALFMYLAYRTPSES